MRIDSVVAHQPGQRGAVRVEMFLLHAPGLRCIAIQQALDVGTHALVDEREEARGRGVEAIVEVEDPVLDVAELGSDLDCHGDAAPSRNYCFRKMKGFE